MSALPPTQLHISLTCQCVVMVTQTRANGRVEERAFVRPLRICGTAAQVANAFPAEAADLVNTVVEELGAAHGRSDKGYRYRFPLMTLIPDAAHLPPAPIPHLTAEQLEIYTRTMTPVQP